MTSMSSSSSFTVGIRISLGDESFSTKEMEDFALVPVMVTGSRPPDSKLALISQDSVLENERLCWLKLEGCLRPSNSEMQLPLDTERDSEASKE